VRWHGLGCWRVVDGWIRNIGETVLRRVGGRMMLEWHQIRACSSDGVAGARSRVDSWRLWCGMSRLKQTVWHGWGSRRLMGWTNMLEGIMVLEVWWHARMLLGREGVFLDMGTAVVFVVFIIIVIATTTFVLEIARTFVFVGLAVLQSVSCHFQSWPVAYIVVPS
jgi:hypothetical protein